jgi:hypothetical protein
MSIDNSVNSVHAPDVSEVIMSTEQTLHNKSGEIRSDNPEHIAMFLIERFAKVITKVYEEMGVGKYIDFNA